MGEITTERLRELVAIYEQPHYGENGKDIATALRALIAARELAGNWRGTAGNPMVHEIASDNIRDCANALTAIIGATP